MKTLDTDLLSYKKYISNAFEASQFHVFRWWNELSRPEKINLLHQIASIDFLFIHDLFKIKSLCKTQPAARTTSPQLTPPNVISVPVNDQE
ncbi:MAG: UDPGP type 1 family protein, partial [Planctomycetes bacterium]|nr:UDPGP type 1 family protein [Planctomycetota bacterium]